MELFAVSLVLTSEQNNPSLFSADFLDRNGIVPLDWGVEGTIVLPIRSEVSYENDFALTVFEKKIQLETHSPNSFDWATEFPRIMKGIISALSHVSYGSVGLNFQARQFVDQQDPTDLARHFKENFLRHEKWLEFADDTICKKVEVSYKLVENVVLSLKIEIGGFQIEDEERYAYICSGNVHHEIPANQSSSNYDLFKEEYVNSRLEEFLEVTKMLPIFD